MLRQGFLLAGLLALGGCWEDTPKGQSINPLAGNAQGAGAAAGSARIRAAAEERVRGIAREQDGLRFRAVEVHRQVAPNTYAVCGQATVSGGAIFIPFVSVVKTGGEALEVEQFVGRTNLEATRVYVELVNRCFDGGGPAMRAGGVPVGQPTPPLPMGLPILEQVGEAPPPAPELVSASAAPRPMAGGTLVMRQNGNLRSTPGGGGGVLRVARPGSTLTIFGTAPGGWYQVGDTAPEGWIHGSLGSVQGNTLAVAQ